MPKLLIVTTVPQTIRSFLTPYAVYFRTLGWKVDALTGCDASDVLFVEQYLDQLWNVNWSRNPLALGHIGETIQRIREIVASEQYDIVHVHTPIAAFVTRFALRNQRDRGKPRVIYTAHGFHYHRGSQSPFNLIYLLLEKLAGRWTDYLVTINHEDFHNAKRFAFVPKSGLRYMPGIGVDTTAYSPSMIPAQIPQGIRHELGLSDTDTLFLMVAEINANKRHQDALKAFAASGLQNIHLALAGTGPLQSEIMQLATKLGINKRVHFLGFRSDIPALLRASSALILVSQREGLPRSIMESLCMETPVIGTDIRGIRDLLSNGGGLIVPVGDIDALRKAIEWITTHPKDAKVMGAKGREQMENNYDLSLLLKQHELLYTTVLQS